MQMAELRLGETRRPTDTMEAALRVTDVARELAWSPRTAHRYVAAWSARQSDPRCPRVRTEHTGRRGRPHYLVDAASLRRWLRPAANTNAVANDAN